MEQPRTSALQQRLQARREMFMKVLFLINLGVVIKLYFVNEKGLCNISELKK